MAGGTNARRGGLFAAVALGAITLGAVALAGPEAEPGKPVPGVFALPELQDFFWSLERETALAVQRKDYAAAEASVTKQIDLAPLDPVAVYSRAKVLALQGRRDAVWPDLRRAVELGFRDARALRADRDFALLQTEAEFASIVQDAERLAGIPLPVAAPPARVEPGFARVDAANTAWDFRSGTFRSFFEFPEADPRAGPIAVGQGEVGDLLRGWFAEGTAAGNWRDLYDNHDLGHSPMDLAAFPQFTRVVYSDDASAAKGLTNGLQLRLFTNAITLGNSSTAVTGSWQWRSMPRLAYGTRGGPALLFAQYQSNHLYVYPEHRDHDVDFLGDVYPANTPYLLISQGSSGSDQPFLQAMAATMAAFRPEVKTALASRGALMPALQMILRRTYRGEKGSGVAGGYFSGEAHPTVFDAAGLDVPAMVRMAHDIAPDALPPVVRLRVLEESRLLSGLDSAANGPESLFDTPCAIARVHRTLAFSRRMVVSARESVDFHGRPLQFHWSVLRGDPKRISFQPLDPQASVVEVRVGWHERRPIREGSSLASNRVDIGVFVTNGVSDSAPAFVTTYFPATAQRTYDANQRIASLDGTRIDPSKLYTDPTIDGRRNWRDEFSYDAYGICTGWVRMIKGERQTFDPDGRMIIGQDGNKPKTKAVNYAIRVAGDAEAASVEVEPKVEASEPGSQAGSQEAMGR